MNDLFFSDLETDICNFADDNTLYASTENVIKRLYHDIPIVINWFRTNEMVVNPNKFQVMFPGCRENAIGLNIDSYNIESSDSVKLLGVTLHKKLTFKPYILDTCSRANRNISALLRIHRYLDVRKATLASSTVP